MKRMTVIATVVLVMAVGAFGADQKIALKVKYVPGTYLVTIKSKMRMTNNEMASSQGISQDIESVYIAETTVDEPDPNKHQKMHITYKRIKTSINSGFVQMSFDSAYPDQQTPPFASAYKVMLDKTIHVTLDAEGNVIKVTGMEKMWDELVRANPAMSGMVNNLKEQLGNKMVEQMFGQARKMFPGEPVAKGESWTVDIDTPIPMMGPVKSNQKCTLKAIESTAAGKVAVIDFTGKMRSDGSTTAPGARPTSSLPMKFTKMNTDQSGTMRVHLDNTIHTDSKVKIAADMVMSVRGPGEPASGEQNAMNIKMKMRGTLETTVVPGKYKAPTTRPVPESPKPVIEDF